MPHLKAMPAMFSVGGATFSSACVCSSRTVLSSTIGVVPRKRRKPSNKARALAPGGVGQIANRERLLRMRTDQFLCAHHVAWRRRARPSCQCGVCAATDVVLTAPSPLRIRHKMHNRCAAWIDVQRWRTGRLSGHQGAAE